MSVPSPKYYEILLPPKRSTTRAFRVAGGDSDWFAGEQPSDGGRRSRSHFLMIFLVGAVSILAWQSYGHAARETIAGLFPQLRWLAPQDAAAPDRIEQITHSVDRIAGEVAASHEQISRSIDHLTAGQEQMTLEIIRLQALSQFAKKEDPPPQGRRAGQRGSPTR